MSKQSLDGWKHGKQRPAASPVKITKADGTVEVQAALPAKQPANYVGGTYARKARSRARMKRGLDYATPPKPTESQPSEPRMRKENSPKGKKRRYFPPTEYRLEGALFKLPENRKD